jgi:hypothetical protein
MDALGTILTVLFLSGVGYSVVLWFLRGDNTLNSEWAG